MEINVDDLLSAVVFSPNGEYLVNGGKNGVRVWRVQDGKQAARMAAEFAHGPVTVSQDGKWIAAEISQSNVSILDAKTCKQVTTLRYAASEDAILAIDFSPDSTRLVGGSWQEAWVWDVKTGKLVHTLEHELYEGYGMENYVVAAKYSPQGDRIATANDDYVRVWDSNDGRLLLDIKVRVVSHYNTGLLWFNNYLFVVSNKKIMRFNATNGSLFSEWPVPHTNSGSSCIALPSHGAFVTHAAEHTVTFFDTTTHSQLGQIQHSEDICSIAISPDDQSIAIGGRDGKIAITSLFCITNNTHRSLNEFYRGIEDERWERETKGTGSASRVW